MECHWVLGLDCDGGHNPQEPSAMTEMCLRVTRARKSITEGAQTAVGEPLSKALGLAG